MARYNTINKNNSNIIKVINMSIVFTTLFIYLINFTTIGLELGLNIKPSVLIKKDYAYRYNTFCNPKYSADNNYTCRTNKEKLSKMSYVKTNVFKKDVYLKYFTNARMVSFISVDKSLTKTEIEKKLKYLNINKITYLYIDKYNGEDLDFVLKLKNLETLIIIDAKNLGNYDKIVGMKKLGYISFNDEVINND